MAIQWASITTVHNDGIGVDLSYTAIPDPAGSFAVDLDLSRSLFTEGPYTINANYENLSASATIILVDPRKKGIVVGREGRNAEKARLLAKRYFDITSVLINSPQKATLEM